MSKDIQMFVECNHIINTEGLEDPSIAPELYKKTRREIYLETGDMLSPSSLKTGTYYVSYTWKSKFSAETYSSPVSKIYIDNDNKEDNDKLSIGIKIKKFITNSIDTKGSCIYIAHTPENLTSSTLSSDELEIESNVLNRLFYRKESNITELVIYDYIINEELKNLNNLTDDEKEKIKVPYKKSNSIANKTKAPSFASKPGACPRCYGKNFYFDVHFDDKGGAVTASNSVKLLQEILKILIEDRGDNLFHQEWGCDVEQRIGKKKRGAMEKFRVELSVRIAVDHLRKIQLQNQYTYQNMNSDEIIESIDSISIEEDGPTGYIIAIEAISQIGEVIAYTVKI